MPKSRTGYVFDLDDTLIKTECRIEIIQNGVVKRVTPKQFAKYTPKSTDKIIFAQFNHLIKPKSIEKYMRKFLKHLYEPYTYIAILTARSDIIKDEFLRFLKEQEDVIAHYRKKVKFFGIDSSDSNDKARIVAEFINRYRLARIHFYDDSKRNIDAVNRLKKVYKGKCSINCHLTANIK